MTIDDLRDKLAKQILEIAIASDNPQYKVDAFKATERYGKTAPAKPAASPSQPNGMAAFAARVKRAEQAGTNGAGEPDDADEPATPDR